MEMVLFYYFKVNIALFLDLNSRCSGVLDLEMLMAVI